jgi:hypothetical protein
MPGDLALPRIEAETLRQMEVGTWRTSAGDLDVLLGIPADTMQHLNRYETLREQATGREVAGCTVYVAHLDHIIASKEVVDRPPDREALPELRALRAAELAAAAYPEGIEAALAQETGRTTTPGGGPAQDLGRSLGGHNQGERRGRSR